MRVIVKYLSHCNVTELGTGEKFAWYLQESDYDVILMDYQLPGLNGDKLVSHARAAAFQGAIVSISSSEYYNQRLLQAGADTALEKQRVYLLPRMIRRALSIAAERTGHRHCEF